MHWLTVVVWVGGIVVILLTLYGLHRLGLRLEERGLIYYWYKKSETGAARAWIPLQELMEPQVRHVIEAEDQRAIQVEDENFGAETEHSAAASAGTAPVTIAAGNN